VANQEHLEHIQHVRARTKILISFGDCAVTGNVTAMRNAYGIEDCLNVAYRENAAVIVGIPEGNPAVPKLLDRVRPVHEVVPVDFYLQGCPPDAGVIYDLVSALLEGRAPAGDGRRFG
jgi:NAD-reducing hydrogenase small subunit